MAYEVRELLADPSTCSAGRGGRAVERIYVHYTGGKGTAQQNCQYFAGGPRGASAHYFLDGSGVIWRSVPDADTAWAVGNLAENQASISIEVCNDGGEFTSSEVEELRWLVRRLMAEHGVPAEAVGRHYDAVDMADAGGRWVDPHKACPSGYTYADDWRWQGLWAYITGGTADAPSGGEAGGDDEPAAEPTVNGVPASTYASWVRDVQRELTDSLARLGLPGCAVDGAYGPETRSAIVRLLQRALNEEGEALDEDGVCGPATLAAIGRHPVGEGCETSGDDVFAVKCGLVVQGWDVDLTTWDWDAACAEACRGHQRAHGLDADGVVGAATLPTLLA